MPTWFEIQVNRSGSDLLISARGSGDREVAPRSLGNGFDVPALVRFAADVERAARHARPLPDELRETARAIGGAILDGDIENMRARLAESANGPLLLRLNIGDPELQALPWEALCLPGQAFGFLATSPDLFPVRRVTTTDSWQPHEIQGALRILAIAPTDTSSLPNLEAALASRVTAGEVEWLEPIVGERARAKYLFERLRRKPTPHVLHFLGHGSLRANVPHLRLADEDDEEKWIPVELVAQEIKSNFKGDLRAVVLEACEGAVPSAFASAAEILARAGADAVVAHLWPVRADVAGTFSEQLYRALTEVDRPTGDISRAVNEARRSLFAMYDSSAQAFSPVIYLRGPNGDIFDFKLRQSGGKSTRLPRIDKPPPPPPPPPVPAPPEVVRDEPRVAETNLASPPPEDVTHRVRLALLHCELDVDDAQNSLDADEIPEVLHETRSAFREICQSEVAALDGSLVEGEGSGFLACFGHPRAHEDDSVRAVRTALRIIEATRVMSRELKEQSGAALVVRVGVHTGWVIASAQGLAEAKIGVVPQVAVMLQQAAQSNTVYISQELSQLVDGFFEVVDRGEQSSGLGRKQVRVRAFEIVRDLKITSRFQAASLRGLSRMIGRQQEAALIMERWEQTRQGRGALVLISADAGIGKSRLAQEIRDRIHDSNHIRLECVCSQYHENTALCPLLALLTQALGFERCMSPEQRFTRLESALKSVNAPPEEYAGPLAEFLDLPMPGKALDLPPKRKRELLLEGTTAILCGLSEKSPVVLVIEDLHWMDPSTAEWLDGLFENLAEYSILLVATTRPQYTAPAAWLKAAHFLAINLTRLDHREVLELILEVTGGKPLPVEIVDDITTKTEGYPLFIEELTRMVIESDAVEERQGTYVLLKPFRSLSIPATLQESLLARLTTLSGARSIAQIGAVIGREFTMDIHMAVSELSQPALKSGLDTLMDRGVVYRRGLLRQSKYVFKHGLVQEVLYDSMMRAEQRKFHKRTAEILEERFPDVAQKSPELLAHHFDQAGMADKALEYWIMAAQQAIAQSASVETLRHTANALQSLANLPPGENRDAAELRLHLGQGPALLAVKGWAAPELRASAERAQQLSRGSNHEDHFRISRGLWGYYMVAAQLARSIVIADELMAIATRENSVDYRLEANATACDSWFWLGCPEKSLAHGLACIEEYSLETHHPSHASTYGEDPSAVCLCYTALSAWLLGRAQDAQALHERATEQLPRYTHRFSHGFVMNGLAWYGCHTQQPELTLKWGEKLHMLAVDNEMPPWQALALTQIGWARGMLGEVDDGLKLIRDGLARWRAAGAIVTSLLTYLLMIEVCRNAGRSTEALTIVEMGLEEAAKSEERYGVPELLRQRGELWMAIHGEEHLDKARTEIQKALEMAIEQKVVVHELRAATSLATIGGPAPAPNDLIAVRTAIDKYQPGCTTRELTTARALLT
ncbi:MAG TPA: CHAT domain-containing protein [Polyangium sp.]|nr:CHAT domain-containing protein [Polyangium sp.]